jgi:hypothetical protein
MKRKLVVMLAAIFTLLSVQAVFASQIGVEINGVAVEFDDQAPVSVDGRTLVPIRGVFEQLGFYVHWDGDTQQATLINVNDVGMGIGIVLTIGSDVFYVHNDFYDGISSHTLEVPAQIIGGRTMLPIRAVLESVGYSVGWDAATSTVIVSTVGDVSLPETTPPTAPTPVAQTAGATITLIDTNVTGEDAIPVAFDAYNQFRALIEPGFGLQSGFDSDFVMYMEMDTIMDGESMGMTTSVSTGNMRANIDGDNMASITIMNTYVTANMMGMTESMEMVSEMFIEMEGGAITFFRMIIDGELFDDPLMTEMLDAVPSMSIPEFTIDMVEYATVLEVGGQTFITIALNAEELVEFIDAILGGMVAGLYEELGAEFSMVFDDLVYTIILDSDGYIVGFNMDFTMEIGMEIDMGFGEVDFVIIATLTAEYVYNHIGPVELTMPR